MKRRILFFAIALLASGCSKKASNELVVGMELTYPPFEMKNTENQPAGIGVEVAQALAADLGKELRIEDMRFDGLIPALNSGKIDIILSSMTRTEQRARAIDFSDGYVTNGLCMLVAKDSTVETAIDLNNDQRKIAVKRGTTGHVYAVENLKMAGLTVLDAAETCVTEVIQKKADAFIYDQISIYQHWKKHPDSTQAILNPIRKETWAIGMKKGQPELLASINAFLKKFKEADGFKALGEKYMAEEKKTFESLGVPFIFH